MIKLRMSSAKRWLNCTASAHAEAQYKSLGSSEAAIDGTGTHLLAELSFINQRCPTSYVGETIGLGHEDKPTGWKVTADRAERAKVFTDYCRSISDRLSPVVSEREVDLGATMEINGSAVPLTGHIDVTVIKQDFVNGVSRVNVVDLKDGRNFVPATDPQLKMYGTSVVILDNIPDGIEVVCTIVQPKTNPSIRSHIYKSEELRKFYHTELLEKITVINHPDQREFKPHDAKGGGWCYFCAHKDDCAALESERTVDVPDAMFRNVQDLTEEDLKEVLDYGNLVASYLKEVEKEAAIRIKNGITVPGYAMLPGRADTKLKSNAEELFKELGIDEDVYMRKQFETITKLRKALSKDIFEKVTHKPKGALKLQPVKSKDILEVFK